MFRNSFQHGFLSVFTSGGSKPLGIWDVHAKNGHCRRLTDEDLRSLVFELVGVNVATTFMVAPCNPCPSLAIKLPFLVMHVKNLRKFFSFEVQVLDDRQSLRRFRFSNYQSGTRVDIFSSSMPMSLAPSWNELQINLADFTRRAYGTNYVETVRLQIHANVRIKRIYFCDRLYTVEELPSEFRLFPPVRPCRIAEMRAAAKHHKHPDEPIEMLRPPTPVEEVVASNQVEVPAETLVRPPTPVDEMVVSSQSEVPAGTSTNAETPATVVPMETVNDTVQSVVHFEETEDDKAEQTADEPMDQPGQQVSERPQNLNDN